MKIHAACFSLFCSVVSAAAGKPPFDLYGFVKGDMYIASSGVLSYGKPSLVAVNQAAGNDTTAISFTAQHSRFGFKGGDTSGSVAVGGLIELDFFVNTANFTSAKPRMRLAYAWCTPVRGFDVRIGQQWDIFSPLNPEETVNTNVALKGEGNYGYRRPQIQVHYEKAFGAVTPSVRVSGGEAASENELQPVQDSAKNVSLGTFLGRDNLGVPLLQARLGVVVAGTVDLGVSGVYASYGAPRHFATEGWSFDATVPVNRFFSLKGEFGGGTNLGDANLQSVAGFRRGENVVTNGIWVSIASKPADFLLTSLGFGREGVTSEQPAGGVTGNMTIFGNLYVPVTGYFRFALEYQWLRTTLEGAPDAANAHVVDIPGVVSF